MTRGVLALLLPLVLAGCTGGDAAGGAGPAVEPVTRAFIPRPQDEDYWETVSRAEVGPRFLLYVEPRIKTPAEGPWIFTFLDPQGNELARHEGMRVDVATARFTFLCRTERFAAGDWTIHMELEEGGMTGGPRVRVFRFRVQ